MDNASSYFQKVVDAFDNNKKNYTRPEINQRILGDATLQLANVFLVSRNFEKASKYYNEIIQNNSEKYIHRLVDELTRNYRIKI